MIFAGIDAGSRSIKLVLYDAETRKVVGRGMAEQGVDQVRLAEALFERTLGASGLGPNHVARTVATGYGRGSVRFADSTVTEITCHARGVWQTSPDARTIIEIGGQDSKVIWIEPDGRVRDFAMNDRCAAGTGRFLEMVATRLGVDLCKLSEVSRASARPAVISSTCVVFAETEIIGLLASGVAVADIAAGVQKAIASRVSTMAMRAVVRPVYFTGGVALQPGMCRALQEALETEVKVVPDPQFTGALGAALVAVEQTS
jgi:predicted CoA-substrate-specific enzyme activase